MLPKAQELTADLSPEQFNRRPAPGMWSVGECLAHLNITNELYADYIAKAIEKGRADHITGEPPFRYALWQRLFVWLLAPPARVRFKAPAGFMPPSSLDSTNVLATWRESHLYLLTLAEASRGLDLVKLRVPSPVNAKLRLSLGMTFKTIIAHDRRHLWQAERVKHRIASESHQSLPPR